MLRDPSGVASQIFVSSKRRGRPSFSLSSSNPLIAVLVIGTAPRSSLHFTSLPASRSRFLIPSFPFLSFILRGFSGEVPVQW